jgi:hypothetical protein
MLLEVVILLLFWNAVLLWFIKDAIERTLAEEVKKNAHLQKMNQTEEALQFLLLLVVWRAPKAILEGAVLPLIRFMGKNAASWLKRVVFPRAVAAVSIAAEQAIVLLTGMWEHIASTTTSPTFSNASSTRHVNVNRMSTPHDEIFHEALHLPVSRTVTRKRVCNDDDVANWRSEHVD